jgi:transcriptional regulator with XRE-family HTH domain
LLKVSAGELAMSDAAFDRRAVARTLRTFRRHSRLKQREVAQRMETALRSYQYLEAGDHQDPSVSLIYKFADATGGDPLALLLAGLLERPEMAIRLADNKLVSLLMEGLVEFNDRVGDEAASLRATEIIEVFRIAFRTLAERAGRPYPSPALSRTS